MARNVAGWLLEEADRARLLALFPPAYDRVIAHHVTLRVGVPPDFPLPTAEEGAVVGLADDGAGVQALVVEIDGTTRRPDGSTWHITWSLAEGRAPIESNAVLRARGWTATPRHPIRLRPAVFQS
jgi:hypothetical protein